MNNEFSKFERKISINEECIEDWNKRMDDETSSESNQTKFRIEQFQEDNKSLNNEIEHIKPKLAMLNHVLRLKTVIEDIEKYSRIKFNDKVIRNQINNFNAEVKREEKNIGSLLSRFDRTITKLGHWQGD